MNINNPISVKTQQYVIDSTSSHVENKDDEVNVHRDSNLYSSDIPTERNITTGNYNDSN